MRVFCLFVCLFVCLFWPRRQHFVWHCFLCIFSKFVFCVCFFQHNCVKLNPVTNHCLRAHPFIVNNELYMLHPPLRRSRKGMYFNPLINEFKSIIIHTPAYMICKFDIATYKLVLHHGNKTTSLLHWQHHLSGQGVAKTLQATEKFLYLEQIK